MDLFSSGLGEVIFQYFGDATRRSQVGGTRQACNALVSMAEGEYFFFSHQYFVLLLLYVVTEYIIIFIQWSI